MKLIKILYSIRFLLIIPAAGVFVLIFQNCYVFNSLNAIEPGIQPGNSNDSNITQTPGAPGLLSNIRFISATGFSVCAISTNESVYCWGINKYGEIGLSEFSAFKYYYPTEIPAIKGALTLGGGNWHNCAVLKSGELYCWGLNDKGQLGNGTTTNTPTPTKVFGLSGVKFVSGGEGHTCALNEVGEVYCWGENKYGQLGNGSFTSSLMPVKVNLVSKAIGIAVGYWHTCALVETGKVMCWGKNSNSELGVPNLNISRSANPVEVEQISNAVMISSNAHTCALLQDQSVKCWGWFPEGYVQDGENINIATTVPEFGGMLSVSAGNGGYYTCGITQLDGRVLCLGDNRYAQLGRGNQETTNTVAPVPDLQKIKMLATSGWGACALTQDMTVKCWGAYVTEVSTSTVAKLPIDILLN